MTFNGGFILIMIIAVVGMAVQSRLQSVFKKYSGVPSPNGMSGKEAAEKMLRDNGITDVQVTSGKGQLTDHYDPRNKTISLSEPVYNARSVAAVAVAAHECGHAIQHAKLYGPLRLRNVLVPIVSFSSMWAQLVIIIGIFTIHSIPSLFWIGIAMFAMVLLFSVITLPVEYNASHRALAWIKQTNLMQGKEYAQAKEALTWAARTYLVSALSALATLIFYLGFARRR